MVWTGYADAAIGCFNGKYTYGFWRPATAIPAGGGKSALTADPAWLPLGATPAHPEYPAAHGCITGAVAPLIASFFGTTRVHVLTDSKAFTDGVHQHTFEDTRDLMDEVFWARIYAGFHFIIHWKSDVNSEKLSPGSWFGPTFGRGPGAKRIRRLPSSGLESEFA